MFISSATWANGSVDAAIRYLVAMRTPCSGVPAAGRPSMPKMPAMITSSVIACIRGASENGLPTGQRAISRSVTSLIIAT